MGRNKKQITLIEENAELLVEIDKKRKDRTITVTEFKLMHSSTIEKAVYKKINDWAEFKKLFIDWQSELGFIWDSTQGYGGPLKLKSIELQPQLGTELSEKLHREEKESGDFIKLLRKNLPTLFAYIDDEINLLNIKHAREEFKVPQRTTGYGYKFKRNSNKFSRKLLKYKYQSPTGKKHETSLGELILQKIQDKFEFIFINHTQEERKEQKYKNIDIEGIKKITIGSEEHFEVYAFELKISNSIPSISEAISQAINYKVCSNFSYIIIPNFDYEHFYDEIRLTEYIEMCRQNKIGIISLLMTENKVKEIDTILDAQKTDLIDYSRLERLSRKKEFKYEKCHLCGKIVNKESREGCGWTVSINDEETSHCMKHLLQEQTEDYLKHKLNKKIDN